MSSLVKAAIISVVVLIVVVAAVLFLRDPRPQIADRDSIGEPPGFEEPAASPDGLPPAVYTPPPVRGTIELTVEILEKGRGRRLPGSRVMVLSAMEGDRASIRSVWESGKDGTGLFQTTLGAGKYMVHAQCPRYKGERRSLTLMEGAPQKLVFELERGNSISGRVLTQAGEPIPGARVQALEELSRPDASIEETLLRFIEIQEFSGRVAAEDVSASDGTYQLDGLDLKYFTVRALADGYAPGEIDQVPAPRDRVDVICQKGLEIVGSVTDTAGRGIGAARIHAYPEVESQNVFDIIMAKARPPLDSTTSDASGAFAFKTLGPGVYNFLVTAKGHQEANFMKLAVSASSEPLRFSLAPGLTIRGLVRGPSEEPVEGARVRATLMGGAQGRQSQANISFDDGSVFTDETGAFQFDTLEDGKYMLLCWHPDFETAQRKDVRPGAEETILRLGGGGRMHGKVLDGVTGQPIPGASVSATDVADLPKVDIAKEDGTYALSGLRVGNRGVSVTVSANGYARGKIENLRVQENVNLEQDFELLPTGMVTGRIVTSAGDPLPGVRVMVRRAQSGSGVETTIDNDMTDGEGRYRLSRVEGGDGNFLVAKRSEFLDEQTGVFTIDPGETLELPDISMRQGGAVGGTVLGPEGQPVAGCVVTILREGDTELEGKLNPSGSTNQRGEYVIPGLRTGVVRLVVKPVRFLERTIDAVQIQEGAHTRVDVQLERGNSIGGRVVDGRGEPIKGAEVLVRDFSRGVREFRTFSEENGGFVVDGVPANDFVEVTVSHGSYGSFSDQKVAVGTTDLEVVLRGLAILTGTVIGADGTLIDSFVVQPQLAAAGTDVRKQLRSENFSSADGSFEYKGLQAGNYTVQVRAMGYATTTIDAVGVNEGEVVDLGAIELQVGGVVDGTVVDALTQRAVPNARVQIVQGSSRFVATSAAGGVESSNPIQFTDSSGHFRFAGLKGGNLTLRVTHQDFVSRELPNVNPDAASSSQGLVISLETGGEVLGTVVDGRGQPRSNMPVYLIGSSASSNQTAKTDRTGQFQFRGVAAGAYTVKAHQFGVPGQSATEQAEKALELPNGGRQEVVLTID